MGGGVGAIGVRLHSSGSGEDENVGIGVPEFARLPDDGFDDAGYRNADGGLRSPVLARAEAVLWAMTNGLAPRLAEKRALSTA